MRCSELNYKKRRDRRKNVQISQIEKNEEENTIKYVAGIKSISITVIQCA